MVFRFAFFDVESNRKSAIRHAQGFCGSHHCKIFSDMDSVCIPAIPELVLKARLRLKVSSIAFPFSVFPFRRQANPYW